VLLQWQTANELNMQGYNVERSANGKDYSGIDNINAKGKGVLPNTYSIIDALPSDGTNYYRLKMINLDGSFAYSNVIKINTDEVITELKLYPNPVHDILNIDFATTNSGNITLKISDASGNVILQKFIHSNVNTLSTSFNIQNFASGVYYVTVEQNGKKQKKIFVVR
jgi:hypothetical protein